MNVHSGGAMPNSTEQRIRRAAIQVFSHEGFHRTRMSDVANVAGIAVGTIYNHFDSKEDLLVSIFETAFEERMRMFDELRAGGGAIRDQLHELLKQHFAIIRKQEELSRLLLLERFHPGGRVREKLIRLQRTMVDRIATLLREGVSEGWVRPCNTQVVAQALFDLIQTMSACGLIYDPKEADEILEHAPDELSDLIWQGLRHPDREGSLNART
jgi:TetR/AcrR family fatty acid metabolism transcriptional regulator